MLAGWLMQYMYKNPLLNQTGNEKDNEGTVAYQLRITSSHKITEVKQH